MSYFIGLLVFLFIGIPWVIGIGELISNHYKDKLNK